MPATHRLMAVLVSVSPKMLVVDETDDLTDDRMLITTTEIEIF